MHGPWEHRNNKKDIKSSRLFGAVSRNYAKNSDDLQIAGAVISSILQNNVIAILVKGACRSMFHFVTFKTVLNQTYPENRIRSPLFS